jgi:hypothetical protein
MTDMDGLAAEADGERVVWTGRSRPLAIAAAVSPNLLVAAFATCLAFGFAPASASLGLLLSPVVDSTLRTVTPLPVPQIFIERLPPRPKREDGLVPIAYAEDAPTAAPGMTVQPATSDVDVGVGVFLLVCKILLLYLAGATALLGVRTVIGQAASQHVVTDRRLLSRRGAAAESVSMGAVRGFRLRRHAFGSSLSIDVSGRRRPFVILGLGHADAAAAERALAAGLRRA